MARQLGLTPASILLVSSSSIMTMRTMGSVSQCKWWQPSKTEKSFSMLIAVGASKEVGGILECVDQTMS